MVKVHGNSLAVTSSFSDFINNSETETNPLFSSFMLDIICNL